MESSFPQDTVSTAFLDRMVRHDVLGRALQRWGYAAFNDQTYRCAVFSGKAGATAYRDSMERFFAQEYPVSDARGRPVFYERNNALCVALPDALYRHVRDDAVEFQHTARQHKGR